MEEELYDDDSLIEQYMRTEGCTPLDVITEKEKRKSLMEMIRFILPLLDEKDKEIIWLYAVKGMNFTQIGAEIGYSRPAISLRVSNMPSKILHKIPEEKKKEWMNCLLPPQSTLEAGYPTSCGYPFEFLQRVNNGGKWVKSDGYPKYYSQWVCKIPEALEECFIDGNKIACPICENCSRAEMRKVRGEVNEVD